MAFRSVPMRLLFARTSPLSPRGERSLNQAQLGVPALVEVTRSWSMILAPNIACIAGVFTSR